MTEVRPYTKFYLYTNRELAQFLEQALEEYTGEAPLATALIQEIINRLNRVPEGR